MCVCQKKSGDGVVTHYIAVVVGPTGERAFLQTNKYINTQLFATK